MTAEAASSVTLTNHYSIATAVKGIFNNVYWPRFSLTELQLVTIVNAQDHICTQKIL